MNRDLQKKIGRLLVCGFEGTKAGEHARFLYRDLKIGNWIFFARNIEGYEQTAELSREIIAETRQNNGDYPYMTIDQEGGIVSRFHGDLNTYPGAMACAAAGGADLARKAAEGTARHIRSLGFNMNLAPVADINSNPSNPIVGSRSYGDTPEQVSRYALAAAEGYEEGGVIPVLKHFPGHGDSATDSHKALPLINHPYPLLKERELYPFVKGIERGVPAIMIAHMLIPALDSSGVPASLSPGIITNLLREQMGFKGLVLTDCLEMQGVRKYYSTEQAVVMALKAGADMLFVSHTPEEQEKAAKALYDEVMKGRLGESRIDRSLARLAEARRKFLPGIENEISPVPGWVGSTPDPELEQISRKSLTLIRENSFLDKGRLTDSDKTLILVMQRPEQFIGENTVSGGNPMLRLKKAFPESCFRIIPADETEEILDKEPVRTEQYDRILLVTADAGFFPKAVNRIQEICRSETPTGIAVMRSPYEAASFPEADFLVLGYENTVLAVDSLIAFLKGEIPAEGRCPVKLGN